MPRLQEIHANLVDHLQEAKDQGWLGEVAAIETTLTRRRAEAGGHARPCSPAVHRLSRHARLPPRRRTNQRRARTLSADTFPIISQRNARPLMEWGLAGCPDGDPGGNRAVAELTGRIESCICQLGAIAEATVAEEVVDLVMVAQDDWAHQAAADAVGPASARAIEAALRPVDAKGAIKLVTNLSAFDLVYSRSLLRDRDHAERAPHGWRSYLVGARAGSRTRRT